jgi:hypothetical protein
MIDMKRIEVQQIGGAKPPAAGAVSPGTNQGPFRILYGGPVFNDTAWIRSQLQTKLQQLLGDRVDVQKWLQEDKGGAQDGTLEADKTISKELLAAIRSMKSAIKELGGPIIGSTIPGPIINGVLQADVPVSSITKPENLTPQQEAIINPPFTPITPDNEDQEKVALGGELGALTQYLNSESDAIGKSPNFEINKKTGKEVQASLNRVSKDLGNIAKLLPAAAPRVP